MASATVIDILAASKKSLMIIKNISIEQGKVKIQSNIDIEIQKDAQGTYSYTKNISNTQNN
jgi:hypothetical protein